MQSSILRHKWKTKTSICKPCNLANAHTFPESLYRHIQTKTLRSFPHFNAFGSQTLLRAEYCSPTSPKKHCFTPAVSTTVPWLSFPWSTAKRLNSWQKDSNFFHSELPGCPISGSQPCQKYKCFMSNRSFLRETAALTGVVSSRNLPVPFLSIKSCTHTEIASLFGTLIYSSNIKCS